MPLFGHVAGRKQISPLSLSLFLSDALILASKGLGGPGGMWNGMSALPAGIKMAWPDEITIEK